MLSIFVIFILIISGISGAAFARFINKRCPDKNLENIFRNIKLLHNLIILNTGIVLIIFTYKINDILRIMPLYIQRYSLEISSTPFLLIAGFISGFGIGFAFLTHYKGRIRMSIILTLMNLVVLFSHSPIIFHLKSSVTSDGVILQTSNSSCAAATLANIAKYKGIIISEREAAAILRTTMLGTHNGQIRYGLSSLGFKIRDISRDTPIEEIGVPAVISIRYRDALGFKKNHAVAYFGQKNGKIEIWDPLIGKCFYSERELYSMWNRRGIECL